MEKNTKKLVAESLNESDRMRATSNISGFRQDTDPEVLASGAARAKERAAAADLRAKMDSDRFARENDYERTPRKNNFYGARNAAMADIKGNQSKYAFDNEDDDEDTVYYDPKSMSGDLAAVGDFGSYRDDFDQDEDEDNEFVQNLKAAKAEHDAALAAKRAEWATRPGYEELQIKKAAKAAATRERQDREAAQRKADKIAAKMRSRE